VTTQIDFADFQEMERQGVTPEEYRKGWPPGGKREQQKRYALYLATNGGQRRFASHVPFHDPGRELYWADSGKSAAQMASTLCFECFEIACARVRRAWSSILCSLPVRIASTTVKSERGFLIFVGLPGRLRMRRDTAGASSIKAASKSAGPSGFARSIR
jgi:hypothetical protein